MQKANSETIVLSVVSHGQIQLVEKLIMDLAMVCDTRRLLLVLTLNTEEVVPFSETSFSFPIVFVKNEEPRGFAANHNSAFQVRPSEFFCVLNPDIRLCMDPFPTLLSRMEERVGVAAPIVMNPRGSREDSARRLPTPYRILKKVFGGRENCYGTAALERPDWIAGMFMMFRSSVFESIGGFDDRYFLYYEDVDLCCRLRRAGYQIVVEPRVSVVHDARRDSHKKLRYLWWHLRSMYRFFTSKVFFSCYFRKAIRA